MADEPTNKKDAVRSGSCCKQRDLRLPDAEFDHAIHILLDMARHYFLSYAGTQKPHWERAIDLSSEGFGEVDGPLIAVRLLNVLRAMRIRRKNTFVFNNPQCRNCRSKITDCERLLLRSIQLSRSGETAHARMEALILCEGFEVEAMIEAMDKLVRVLPPLKTG